MVVPIGRRPRFYFCHLRAAQRARRIWLCTALHFAWNFLQGAVFSIAVSGQSGESWLHGTLTGPAWLSGVAFGAEGSLVAVVLCLAMAGVLLKLAHKRGRLSVTTPA